jgi:predicted lysophospholipase L1 biosynthesis ABC-type transport system permease subunit
MKNAMLAFKMSKKIPPTSAAFFLSNIVREEMRQHTTLIKQPTQKNERGTESPLEYVPLDAIEISRRK